MRRLLSSLPASPVRLRAAVVAGNGLASPRWACSPSAHGTRFQLQNFVSSPSKRWFSAKSSVGSVLVRPPPVIGMPLRSGSGSESSGGEKMQPGNFGVMVFNEIGEFEERVFSKQKLLQTTGLPARDLIVLDSGFHRRPRPAILVRDHAIIVCMSFIRAIVRKDDVFLFHTHDLDVRKFSTKFSEYLRGRRPPFLPAVSLGSMTSTSNAVSRSVMDDPEEKGEIFCSSGEGSKDLPFECKALEGILSHVCRQYYNRTLLLSPLVTNVLDELSSRRLDPETLHKLLPMKDVLSQFEIETTLMRNELNLIMQNEDMMVQMLLTEKDKRGGERPPLEDHTMVELLLENYTSQLVDISQEAYYLRKRVESTQSIIELKLDTYRNHMLRINLQLAMVSIALACSTCIAGVFGMNLTSGFEEHPSMFYWVVGTSSVGVLGVLGLLNLHVQRTIPMSLEHETVTKSVFNFLNEVEYILSLARSARNSAAPFGATRLTKEEFAKLLNHVAGTHIDDEEIDIIYKTFDLDSDGVIHDKELNKWRESLAGYIRNNTRMFRHLRSPT